MRVLLSTYGSRGDVEPLVALAVQLQRRDAEVRMCAPPDEEFVELLARTGVPHVPFLKPWRSWERPPTPEERHQRVTDFIAAQYDTVAEAAVGCDLVVATAMSQFVAPSVAERLGVPYHYVLFCPDVVDGLDGQTYTALFKEPLDAHRTSIGLAPVEDVSELMFTRRPLLAADPVLGPWHRTSGLDAVQTGAWMLDDGRPLPDDLVAFIERGPEPVYVGFGSMRTVGEKSARVAVEAVRAQGRRVLIGRGWAGLDVVDGREDYFVVGEVNHQRLFGRVAAVVHHGGAGTTTTAYRAGAPQVIVPQGGDQAYWAGRVADLGIGTAHDGAEATVESLSVALEAALEPKVRARAAAAMAGPMAAQAWVDGAARAADLLLTGQD
ncbi:vancomycin aglycone glucosyltransferase [Nocardioides luteus]|uniref:Glycosyl transferase n=1 Tax=Nocardioides luteus TaxID=1844 RepID=A0ABQ5T2G8_9ACTN|nr:glycosyltransferase [Nocardioides luteus]MDR7311675.1 vancomycin aglycone glucosyltransferase [Nocardioides luteus]GGR72542.1 glycosyl transferase [Nocardioides luteus]GLJ70013.1 glycosyl transferase [Nocardioides luteus]